MDKENPSFLEALMSEAVPAPSESGLNEGGADGGSSSTPVGGEQPSPMTNPQSADSGKGKGTEKGEIDYSIFMSKMASVNQSILKLKEVSLVGFVSGKPMEMGKVVNKLKQDWVFLQAPFKVFCKGNRWFEIRFANAQDKERIWEGRPYHLFSQLLLLKPWSASFDSGKESTTKLDMWVRILQLPPQFMSPDVLKAIIEMNNIGDFVKLDPFTERGINVSFPRLRICAEKEGLKDCWVSVPDEYGNLMKFKVWCEEYQKGCGFCGDEGHLYPVCPLRITQKKRGGFGNAKNKWSSGKDGWQKVPKKKSRNAGEGTSADPLHKNIDPGFIPNDDMIESSVNLNPSSPFLPVQYNSKGQVIYLMDDLEVENDPENLEVLNSDQMELLRNFKFPNAEMVNEEFTDATSNNSFVSFSPNNSTVSKLGKLAMEVTPAISIGSGKKREKDGDSDTASSKLKGIGNKRMRINE